MWRLHQRMAHVSPTVIAELVTHDHDDVGAFLWHDDPFCCTSPASAFLANGKLSCCQIKYIMTSRSGPSTPRIGRIRSWVSEADRPKAVTMSWTTCSNPSDLLRSRVRCLCLAPPLAFALTLAAQQGPQLPRTALPSNDK